jgi:diguanylate cyclase (GGDEF)-like protein
VTAHIKKGNIAENIKAIDIFSDLNNDEALMLFSRMKSRTFDAGESLFKEGDSGDQLYIIVSGRVSITVNLPDGKELILSEISGGNFFGEMSIIERAPRSATCRTLEKTECLSLHADDFNALIEEYPATASSIMNRMLAITAQRLVNVGSFLSQMVQWGESSRKRAITDPATGLFNRRYMDDSFASIINRANLDGKSMCFVMFDMDHFGSLNTKYGQDFGDKIIASAADTFKNNFRTNDILVRYGGDEFVFILPDADRAIAQSLCDSLCAAFRTLTFPEHDELQVTCSMGFACFPEHAQTPESLMEKADKALYKAKESGRDKALCFSE